MPADHTYFPLPPGHSNPAGRAFLEPGYQTGMICFSTIYGGFLDGQAHTSDMPSQLLFLPGALGRTELWAPVADRLDCPAHRVHVGWPGFGSVPADPLLSRWFVAYRQDLSARLPALRMPALLLWGGDDPVSPVRVGERLAGLLPRSDLHIVAGGGHGLVETHAAEVAPLIDHLLAHKPVGTRGER